MFDLLKFLSRENASKNVAKERLKLVLVHDRSNCSPEFLEMIKEDLLASLSRYVEYDENEMDIQITKTSDDADGRPALVANIPIKQMKRK